MKLILKCPFALNIYIHMQLAAIQELFFFKWWLQYVPGVYHFAINVFCIWALSSLAHSKYTVKYSLSRSHYVFSV